MMHIVVSDTSCLIDLQKTSLLEAFARLPYDILIPDVLYNEELLKFSPSQKRDLLENNVRIAEIEDVQRVADVQGQNLSLSTNDCFAFVLAETHEGCIFLTGDKCLRTCAEAFQIDVHGTLWVIDEIHKNNLAPPKALYEALLLFEEDETVYLPVRSLQTYIRKYKALL